MSQARYRIGIDLGTTNCTVAYAAIDNENPEVDLFAISQQIAAGEWGESLQLPSFVYFPLDEERKAKIVATPWEPNQTFVTGVYARDRGSELPSRLISSAKSWLCHAGIDRRAAILPTEQEEGNLKKSPLDATAELLRHIKQAWEAKMPKEPFVKQEISITVPASFDPSARQLVEEAAQQAGYPSILLLEEPQAAFYSWLLKHQDEWRKLLKVGDVVLVVDIGGGTSDFSLIAVEEHEGNLTLRRQAVGSHLLLGGDNIDLSLAYFVRDKLEEKGQRFDEAQMPALVHQCRQAKERLLGEEPPAHVDITLAGRGSKLVGGSQKVRVTREEVQTLLLDGFLPLVSPTDRSSVEKRLGLQQLGLPYARDARISCQLAKFLSMTGEVDSSSMERFVMPTAILFNGGTMKSPQIRQRLLDLLNNWAKELNRPAIQELPNPDFDYAVSHGAVAYSLARAGKGIRIKAGTSRSYFIGVEEAAPAIPGRKPRLQAVCIAPFGMEEGSQAALNGQEFALVLGEPATFRFFSHSTPNLSNGEPATVGTTVSNWQEELSELHAIETELEKGSEDGKVIRVTLESHVTELGLLELWCVSSEGRRWKLEFDIRREVEQ